MDFKGILSYSSRLAINNNRTWFHDNHTEYEKAKKDFYGFLDLLRFRISDIAPELGKSIMYMEPKEWAYRIARDMRYHKNGPPYNPAFRAYISSDKKSDLPIGYFLRIAPGTSCFGTGVWCSTTERMNSMRHYILDNFDYFQKLMDENNVSVSGDMLKKLPKGFTVEGAAAEYIKMKNWSVIVHISDEELTDFDTTADYLAALVARMEPMRLFLLQGADYKKVIRPEFEW